MSRRVRRLLLLGVAVGGLWVLYRVLVERTEHGAGPPSEPPRLDPGRQPPALPPAGQIRDLDAFSAERAVAAPVAENVEIPSPAPAAVPTAPTPTAAAEPEAEPPEDPVDDVDPPAEGPDPPPPSAPEAESPGRSEPGNLDKVRERLASIHVDLPPSRGAAPSTESTPPTRARRRRRSEPWQEPAPDGTCAPSHPIKVKVRSGLFHLPGMFAYERTKADRCYRTSADAEADGFERAKR